MMKPVILRTRFVIVILTPSPPPVVILTQNPPPVVTVTPSPPPVVILRNRFVTVILRNRFVTVILSPDEIGTKDLLTLKAGAPQTEESHSGCTPPGILTPHPGQNNCPIPLLS